MRKLPPEEKRRRRIESQKRYRESHADQIRAYNLVRKEQKSEYGKKYYRRYKHKWKLRQKKLMNDPNWRTRHKMLGAAYYRSHKQDWVQLRKEIYANPEKYKHYRKRMNVSNRTYYLNNKPRSFADQCIRRAKRFGVTSDSISVLMDIYQHAMTASIIHCFYCAQPIPLQRQKRHLDHKTPLARGGPNTRDNIVICCQFCNQSKGPLTVEEFLERRKRLEKLKH